MITFVPSSPQGLAFVLTNRADHGRAVWRLASAVKVVIDADRGSTSLWHAAQVTIPAGFETDGASIPSWARPWLDPWSRIGLAALLHDYLLTRDQVAKWDADLQFLHALRSQGVPAFLATLLYFAVRLRRPGKGSSVAEI